MSKNVVTPQNVSFEDALRNLAGHPAAELPRSQEAIVQYMAENIPAPAIGRVNADELAEVVTQKVMARIKPDELAKAITQEVQETMACTMASGEANTAATELAEEHQDGAKDAGGTSTPPAEERAQTAAEAPEPKRTRKTTTAKANR